MRQFEDENTVARQTIPAPAQLLEELFREENGKNTVKFYPDEEVLIQDIVKAYRTALKGLYDAEIFNLTIAHGVCFVIKNIGRQEGRIVLQ